MKQELVRFGIAMEAGLLEQLDHLAEQRGSNRSEVLIAGASKATRTWTSLVRRP
jgi:metal-responsive CopG/Arc/MetJ family transcriptional regulator